MSRQPVIYTRLSECWTAELPGISDRLFSAPTLAEVQAVARTAMGSALAVDPADVRLEELVDAGEAHYARLP
jgi:hypothetical protein